MKPAAVGIVVIGRNEGERLVRCLRSAVSASEKVVYVDSGSTDGSMQIAEQLGVRALGLDLRQPFTAARARNEGFMRLLELYPDVALVQFVDGDCELNKQWVATASSFLSERHDVGVVCGRREERYPEASTYNRVCDLEWDTPCGEAHACGGDAMYRVAAFRGVNGFCPSIQAGEEPELCYRMRRQGWKIWRHHAKMTIHDAAMKRFGQWWKRAVRSGYGYAELTLLHPHTSPLYKKEAASAVFWAGAIPIVIIVATAIHPAGLALIGVYGTQIFRIARRRGFHDPFSWKYAGLMTVGKFAELQGILTFLWRKGTGRSALFDYKRSH